MADAVIFAAQAALLPWLSASTHAGAKAGAVPGVAYDAAADARSFSAVRGFLADVCAAGGIAGH